MNFLSIIKIGNFRLIPLKRTMDYMSYSVSYHFKKPIILSQISVSSLDENQIKKFLVLECAKLVREIKNGEIEKNDKMQ